MKSFLYIFTFIIAICSNVKSQNFNIEYGLPFPSAEECIGKAFEHKGHYVSLISTQSGTSIKYSIVEMSKYGDILKAYKIEDTTSFTCLDWVKNEDGNYYILTKESKGKDIFTLHFLKLNNNLLLESKINLEFDFTYIHRINMRSIENGTISIYGSAGNNSIAYDSKAIYYEFNIKGELLWKTSYSLGFASWGINDFTKDNNNTYLLGASYDPSNKQGKYHLYKYNSMHEKVLDKEYSTNPDYYTQIFINSKGQIVLIGRNSYGASGKHFGHIVVSIRNTSGSEKDKKSYLTYETRTFDCYNDSKGDLVCAGWSYIDTLNNSGLIIKLSDNGDYLWSRYYAPYKSNQHVFNKINSTSDGGSILTGRLLSPSDTGLINNKEAWIIKVDSFGFDHTTQWPDSSLLTEMKSENILFLYPNPTSGVLFYNWWDIAPEQRENYTLEIYSILGQLVKKLSLNSQDINLSSFSSGIYTYMIRYKNTEIVKTGKIALVQGKQ